MTSPPQKLLPTHDVDFVRSRIRLQALASRLSDTKMAGRKSTAPSKPQAAKPKKKKDKRSLNALAIAEAQNPSRLGVRQNRLGHSDSLAPKRKRDEEDLDEEESRNAPGKRRRSGGNGPVGQEVEFHSDSSGNEWTVGAPVGEDDSDLDSDEAFGESDEEKFEGFALRGSSSMGGSSRTPKSQNSLQEKRTPRPQDSINLDEESGDAVSENGDDVDLGDDAVDLADVLDDDVDGSSDATGSARSVGGDLEADEESYESNSEESALAASDGEGDVADPTKLASLQSLVFKMDPQQASTKSESTYQGAEEMRAPTEYGVSSKRKLTVADLMPSITDPQLRKSLKMMMEDDSKPSSARTGIARKLEPPLPQRQQDQIDRTAAYEKSKETLSRWIETVKHNRRAEHLSFPLKDPRAVDAPGSRLILPNLQTNSASDLESAIESILQESGLVSSQGQSTDETSKAFEELEANKVPFAEMQARRAELRRARDLLFREEIRAKRIKKIKSKAYRKVHRKERERGSHLERDALAANGHEESESEKERNDRRRAEARMGAKHRESRWAKGVKESGRAKWDMDARDGVAEMARRDEELRRRMEGKDASGSGSDFSGLSDDDGDTAVFDNEDNGLLAKLSGSVDVLQDDSAIFSKLANMEFMKKADSAQKGRNRAEVESFKRDLNGDELSEEDNEREDVGRRSFGPNKRAMPKLTPVAAKEQRGEFEERESNGSDVEDVDGTGGPAEETEIVTEVPERVDSKALKDRRSNTGHLGLSKTPPFLSAADTISSNPWLASASKTSKSQRHNEHGHERILISNNITSELATDDVKSLQVNSTTPDLQQSIGRMVPKTRKPHRSTDGKATESAVLPDNVSNSDSDEESTQQPPHLSNQDLIRRAFAGDSVIAEFDSEKAAAVSSELPQEVDMSLPGWGTWAGAGLTRREQRHAKAQRKQMKKRLPGDDGVERERRQDAKLKGVIISEKRVKKNDKYLATQLPHPFETRQQYERSLRLPVGPEWTTKETFQGMTKPRILLKQGVITSMVKPVV